MEKYPLDSAFKKEEVKPVQPQIVQQAPPQIAPVVQEVIKKDEPKKVAEPAPIPKIETPKPEEPKVEVKQLDSDLENIDPRAGFYFKNITNMNLPLQKQASEIIEDMESEKEEINRVLKNSFFSMIKEKMQKNELHTIPSDSTEFLSEMRRHHDMIAEKEKILKEKSALDSRLAEKIMLLELLEEGWYLLRKEIETKQLLLLEKEKLIDQMTKDLKTLMNKSGSFDKGFEKATITPVTTQKIIPPDKWFVLKNGRKIGSINELKETLKSVDDETFYHHVSSQRNDFSSWIRHVFSDANLADKILSAKSKHELIAILESWKEL